VAGSPIRHDGWYRCPTLVAFGLSGLFFAFYAANVLSGKLSVLTGSEIRGVGDVAEFLFLFFAVICFVAGTLLLERRRDRPTQHNPEGGNHGP
jgi:hypothetical protein